MIVNNNGVSFTNSPATTRRKASDPGRNAGASHVTDPVHRFKVWTDDDYMAMIEQYKNEPWYDKLLENPWLFSRQAEYSPNILQQLAEAFGNTSSRDAYYANLQAKQQQWLSDTLSQYHQQDFESAPNQAELDEFYVSLAYRCLGGYFHFIIKNRNEVEASRPMAFAPSIL